MRKHEGVLSREESSFDGMVKLEEKADHQPQSAENGDNSINRESHVGSRLAHVSSTYQGFVGQFPRY